MVKVINYKKALNSDGKEFLSLKVQGGVEAAQSKQTGKMYLTAKTAYVPCTFDEQTAQALVGSDLPGKVVKVSSEPYDFIVRETGETMTLTHRYEYQLDDVPTLASNPVPKEKVLDLLEA